MPDKHQIKVALEIASEANLPDGAYWQMVHDILNMEYGDVFSIIAEDPEFYNEESNLPSIEEMSGSIDPDCEIFETRKERENA